MIVNGTRSDQRVVITRLAGLAAAVQPAASMTDDVGLLVIGDVVRLADLSSEHASSDVRHAPAMEASVA